MLIGPPFVRQRNELQQALAELDSARADIAAAREAATARDDVLRRDAAGREADLVQQHQQAMQALTSEAQAMVCMSVYDHACVRV